MPSAPSSGYGTDSSLVTRLDITGTFAPSAKQAISAFADEGADI
jgi:hypothetical protein